MSLTGARLRVASSLSCLSSSGVFKSSQQKLLPGFVTAQRKLTGYGIQCNFQTNRKRFLSEVGKIDELDFSIEILAIQLHCKIMSLIA